MLAAPIGEYARYDYICRRNLARNGRTARRSCAGIALSEAGQADLSPGTQSGPKKLRRSG